MTLASDRPRLSKPARVLVVDDERVNRLVASSFCEMFGANVDCACSGEEAILSCFMNDYDVILMDIRMPKLDGVEAARAIRLLGENAAEVPIIAVTADVSADLSRRCAEVGILKVLMKPIGSSVVFEAIQAALDQPRSKQAPTALSA